ncbi:hypothetical protein K461DRAFT_269384 [Myriangium duriaei CBS 260.36]|uniref:Pheromone alpha factor receptor n=1 Tax=Myriangium duriaei CBS 260.36 TaxID=1168546 RepID=A0A9P4IY80_9PEZI|nr:hypothetical protein K461DRAFT_269384 [Myriangium duriaei CBS 260.36]
MISDFNPLNQSFLLLISDGEEVPADLGYLNYWIRVGIQESIVSASQIGAALTILTVLLVLTKPDKRRSPVFLLNCLALFLVFTTQLTACLYWTSSWFHPYALLTLDYSHVTIAAKFDSIIGGILASALLITIEASLILQVHVVTITLPFLHRLILLLLSLLIALSAITLRIIQLVSNTLINILRMENNPGIIPIMKARDITLAASICFFSAVFCAKLGWSMRERRRLGVSQYGPMRVIFIGGTQTLVIPAIFAILQFIFPETKVDGVVLTSVAISLPLTSLWAASVSDAPRKPARTPEAALKLGFISSRKTDESLESPTKREVKEKVGIVESVSSASVERDAKRDLEMQDLVKA